MSITIIDQLKKKKILSLLKDGQRMDGRSLDEPRSLVIDTNVIPKAEGSARVRLGDTEVVAGVKVQPDKPFPDLGDRGISSVLQKSYHLQILALNQDRPAKM
jgi:exosome complex component RRP42